MTNIFENKYNDRLKSINIIRLCRFLKKQIPIVTKDELRKISNKCKLLKMNGKKLMKNRYDENIINSIKKILIEFLTLSINKNVLFIKDIKVIGNLTHLSKSNIEIQTLAKLVKKNFIKQLDEEEEIERRIWKMINP